MRISFIVSLMILIYSAYYYINYVNVSVSSEISGNYSLLSVPKVKVDRKSSFNVSPDVVWGLETLSTVSVSKSAVKGAKVKTCIVTKVEGSPAVSDGQNVWVFFGTFKGSKGFKAAFLDRATGQVVVLGKEGNLSDSLKVLSVDLNSVKIVALNGKVCELAVFGIEEVK